MDCPQCGYFIEVENRDYEFECIYCKSLLSYKQNDYCLTVKIPRKINSTKTNPQNKYSGQLLTKKCTQCGAPVSVYHPERSHSFICPQCHSPLYWDASAKDIDADTKRAELAHKEKMAKFKKQLEQQRHENKLIIEQQRNENAIKLEKQRAENERKRKKSETGEALIIILITLALLGLIAIFGNHQKQQKAEELMALKDNPEIIFAPYWFTYFENMALDKAVEIFKDAGFSNLQSSKTNKESLVYTSEAIVDFIDFNGTVRFNTESYINKNDPVIIYYHPITIKSPIDSEDIKDKTKDEVYNAFINAGFKNVKTIQIPGGGGLFKKKNLVDHVVFGDKSYFYTSDFIDRDDPVLIYYYEK